MPLIFNKEINEIYNSVVTFLSFCLDIPINRYLKSKN